MKYTPKKKAVQDAQPRGQPVHPVDEVQGVVQHHEHEERHRVTDPHGQRADAQEALEAREAVVAQHDDEDARQQLPRQLPRSADVDEVVHEANQQDEENADEDELQPVDDLEGEQRHREEKRYENVDAPHVRHRPHMRRALVGLHHEIARLGHPHHHGHERPPDEERHQGRHVRIVREKLDQHAVINKLRATGYELRVAGFVACKGTF